MLADLTTYLNKVLGLLVLEDCDLVGDGALASVVDVKTLGATVLATGIIHELILSLPSGLWLSRLRSMGGIRLLYSLLFARNASCLGAVGLLGRHFG